MRDKLHECISSLLLKIKKITPDQIHEEISFGDGYYVGVDCDYKTAGFNIITKLDRELNEIEKLLYELRGEGVLSLLSEYANKIINVKEYLGSNSKIWTEPAGNYQRKEVEHLTYFYSQLNQVLLRFSEMVEEKQEEITHVQGGQEDENPNILTSKQRIILLEKLGVLDKIDFQNNKESASKLIAKLIDRDESNIRKYLTYLQKEKPKNSNHNPYHQKENEEKVIKLLDELGYSNLA